MYLQMINQPPLVEPVTMFSWATLHREGMFHLPHTHPDNVCLYLQGACLHAYRVRVIVRMFMCIWSYINA